MISTNENFGYGYSHSYALLQLCLKLEPYNPHNLARHSKIYISQSVIIRIIYIYIYRRIYRLNFCHYPIRRHVTKASALLLLFVQCLALLSLCTKLSNGYFLLCGSGFSSGVAIIITLIVLWLSSLYISFSLCSRFAWLVFVIIPGHCVALYKNTM